jgi:uncharacterized membrane protein YidH (DUF202 family)
MRIRILVHLNPEKAHWVRGLHEIRKETYFETNKIQYMAVFGVVIALFVLAIVSVWVFPNKSVSNNEHDIKH